MLGLIGVSLIVVAQLAEKSIFIDVAIKLDPRQVKRI
jgi:hypothetical protein